MNPNEQPSELDQPNQSPDSTPNTSPEPAFSSSPEPTALPDESTQNEAPSEPQPLTQPVDANPQNLSQPVVPVAQPTPVSQPVATTGENPGQTLGIISIVLSLVGLSVVGIILGVISRKKSKAVGASTTLGTIGMVLGIVVTVINVLLLIFVMLAAYGSIQDKAREAAANEAISSTQGSNTNTSNKLSSQAATVTSKAEAYKALTGDYPKSLSDFEQYPESKIDSDIYVYTIFVTSDNVSYLYCQPGSAQVVYYEDASGTKLNITALGAASSTKSCVEIKQ